MDRCIEKKALALVAFIISPDDVLRNSFDCLQILVLRKKRLNAYGGS